MTRLGLGSSLGLEAVGGPLGPLRGGPTACSTHMGGYKNMFSYMLDSKRVSQIDPRSKPFWPQKLANPPPPPPPPAQMCMRLRGYASGERLHGAKLDSSCNLEAFAVCPGACVDRVRTVQSLKKKSGPSWMQHSSYFAFQRWRMERCLKLFVAYIQREPEKRIEGWLVICMIISTATGCGFDLGRPAPCVYVPWQRQAMRSL